MTNKKRKLAKRPATLTEVELFGKDFMKWKREVTADLAKVDAIFKKHFGMTTDELWKHMQDRAPKRKPAPKRGRSDGGRGEPVSDDAR